MAKAVRCGGPISHRLGADRAVAGGEDRRDVFKQPPDLALFPDTVRLDIGLAIGEEFGEDGAEFGQVPAAGAEQVEVWAAWWIWATTSGCGRDGCRSRVNPFGSSVAARNRGCR